MSNQSIKKAELQVSRGYVGPVPPPDILEKFEKVKSGTADRILKLTEHEQEVTLGHIIEGDKQISSTIENRHKERMYALIFSFVLAIIFVIAGCWLTYTGHENIGGLLLGTTLSSVIYSFLTSRKKKL